MMTCFFCYSILEQTTGLWAATYLKLFKGMDAASAAAFAGMLFLGVTPVSYTHLDVYKRQAPDSANSPGGASGGGSGIRNGGHHR